MSVAGTFELVFLFAYAGGLEAAEAIVCLLVTEDSCPAAGRACVEAPRLTVLAEVCLLNDEETADLVVPVLSCDADFKEVWDEDLFILGAGCDKMIFFLKRATSFKTTAIFFTATTTVTD